MATVATGTPRGIWTMESRESTPSKCAPLGFTGTPITGKGVMAATMPGRWAAPPAPAMMTRMPRLWASRAKSNIREGVLCADTIVTSHGTPKSSSTSAAAPMTGRSESDPMITETWGCTSALQPASACSSGMADPLAERISDSLFLTVFLSGPTRVMWPTLRCLRTSSLPYQWTAAPGTAMAEAMSCSAWSRPSCPSASPRMLSMMLAPTTRDGSPRGQPITLRRCCSNWEVAQASMV
mmetsp:Transcript_28623/g.80000  ORF Transcript_28623/g.80000 Transcript_28623/m.80000 type:complete len:238 (-) Transcript_28623:761-1474(-)